MGARCIRLEGGQPTPLRVDLWSGEREKKEMKMENEMKNEKRNKKKITSTEKKQIKKYQKKNTSNIYKN